MAHCQIAFGASVYFIWIEDECSPQILEGFTMWFRYTIRFEFRFSTPDGQSVRSHYSGVEGHTYGLCDYI